MKISGRDSSGHQERIWLPAQYHFAGPGRAEVRLPDVVGKGYGSFWRWKGRYRVCKGSRASKKSKTAALWYITNMMKYPAANTLVIRKTFRTLKDSCFTELKWAIHRLGVDAFWEIKESPLEMAYSPTGQKIYFRGLDDPLKVTSITVDIGCLCWMWMEEAYEVSSEDDFDMLDESIRGTVPVGLFKQITLTLNPWNEHHWIKKRFFDAPDAQTLAMTTNYMCNEWLDKADRKMFETMRERNPGRYKVAGLGDWGATQGTVYTNWEIREFDWQDLLAQLDKRADPVYRAYFGLDFGFSISQTAFIALLASVERGEIWIFDEIYKTGMTNKQIVHEIRYKQFHKEKIVADSEDARTINELVLLGLNRLAGARKGPGSVRSGIQKLQDYKIYVHPSCENAVVELANYCWKTDQSGEALPEPAKEFDHLMDAMRYATETLGKQNFSF